MIEHQKRRGRKGHDPAARAQKTLELRTELAPILGDEPVIERHTIPGGGLKTVLTPHGVHVLRELAASGIGKKSISAVLGVSVDVLLRLQREHPEVDLAFNQGRARLEHALAMKLYAEAMKPGPTSITPSLFMLKHLGWDDRGGGTNVEQTTNVQIVLPKALTPDDYAKTIDHKPDTEDEAN